MGTETSNFRFCVLYHQQRYPCRCWLNKAAENVVAKTTNGPQAPVSSFCPRIPDQADQLNPDVEKDSIQVRSYAASESKVNKQKTQVWTFARCSVAAQVTGSPNRGKTGNEIAIDLTIKED